MRYVAITSGPINRKRKKTILTGIIFRDNYIEGLLSSDVNIDGADSTAKIIKMIGNSRFKDQIRIVLLNGIAIAGLNIVEPKTIEKRLNARVVLLNKRKQNARELVNALREFSRLSKKDVRRKIRIVEDYSSVKIIKFHGLFLQSGLDENNVKRFAERAFEALRVSHIVSSGVAKGESKGRL